QISVGKISSAELSPAESRDGEDDIGFVDILPSPATVLALEHNSYTLPENRFRTIYTGDPAPAGVASYGFQTSPLPGFSELGAGEAHHPELFDAARRRLESHLEAARKRGCAIFEIDGLSGGFEIPGMIVVSKADRVFAKRKTVSRRGSAQGARLNDFDEIEPGEYVVHVDYGVGRYIGSSEIETGGGRRNEVFTIEYADGAKLHVPAAHAHLLSRYVGVKGEKVRLHRLDGKRWEKDRQNAQKAVNDLAAALLETQARREIMPGFAYDTACEGLDAFEAAFPYEETGDQLAAIEAVKKDMAARKPMDRLICGDAGYGKTEVAMRAAYIAALNGKQTAVLAPTTVLAEQHFETFSSRFDGTPVRIEPVSRFQSSGVHGGTFSRLASGACDIVIGTHAILSPKVAFRDLGLIIIDEEQRFGVRQKETLKRLRATADVLTLSATPIPRTLYLSMTGARDLSLLKTPPRERVAVETTIVRDSDATVKRAIESELARGGQVFFLHNRVATIGRVERRLAGICPEARIAVAHGKMDSLALARKMRDFERGEFDVLLSTAIVESGIDIPRANTIIVDRADTFGLADLYQLRGRVGRGSRQGYAYFLLNASGSVDSDARERLSALKRHGGLGAGFSLAVRDLELRGAGNLLGSQQSGHIAAIGFGLYCQLLKRTVSMLKGEKIEAVVDCRLNLDFVNPCLPYDYIEDDAQRLGLLRRFAEARDEAEVRTLAREMRDRFGPPPPDAAQFVQVARLRTFCAKAGISQVDASGNRAIFYRAGSQKAAFVRDLKGKTAEKKIDEIKAAAADA
ncbi:MAG: transcription-repair coupling factor, partial [Kiritimatiellae bacterium]|nr:transcription-repair coupling factor [Kiritimatiellia bacterium]